MKHSAILDEIVLPRPNGSEAFFEVAEFIRRRLQEENIAVDTHSFLLRPCMLPMLGLTIVISAVLCTYLALTHKALAAAALPLVVAVIVAELVLHIPIVSGLYQVDAENLVVKFHPSDMKRELIFSAHYDSKTQPFDHHQRSLIIGLSAAAAAAWVVVTGLRWRMFSVQSSVNSTHDVLQRAIIYILSLHWLTAGFAFGGGSVLKPSDGAVDNAGSVAVMMLLAGELAAADLPETGVTLLFTAGEELNMQGSRAYVNDRLAEGLSHPVFNINLEFVAQEGGYVYWTEDGNLLRQLDTCRRLNEILGAAVHRVTGEELQPMPPGFVGFSDSASFLAAKIPSTTLSSAGSDELGTRRMHTSLDNRDRLMEDKIPQVVNILKEVACNFSDLQSASP